LPTLLAQLVARGDAAGILCALPRLHQLHQGTPGMLLLAFVQIGIYLICIGC
jgi:hypothetical protein